MSFVENLKSGSTRSFVRTLPGTASRTGGKFTGHKWLMALDELVYMPVRVAGWLPVVTTGARAEAQSITITRNTLGLRQWPSVFEGMTVAFLTDLHCSAITPPSYLAQVIEETNRLKPDLVLLGGDYVTAGTDYIRPVADVLAKLKAPLGIYSVLGNHDHIAAPDTVRAALKRVGIVDVNNAGHWITLGGERMRIAGIGDMWEDRVDLKAALSGATAEDAVILLSHNPDYSMQLTDARVRLMLSGHTHGGQIVLPGIGAVVTNTSYGLVSGLFPFETFQLYVSRGLGTVVTPLRYRCPPEIALLTLHGC